MLEALRAAQRALRSDGELLFCEHALAPDASVQAWQRRLEHRSVHFVEKTLPAASAGAMQVTMGDPT